MLTWQVDRILRSGPLCAAGTFILPALLAIVVDVASSVENVLGLVLLASLIIFIGSAVGSIVTSGFGVLLFAVGATVAELPAWLLVVIGIGLFATLVLHDLAGTFRRAPRINRTIWLTPAAMVGFVAIAGSVVFAGVYFLATLATWQTIVVPFGIAAIGFAAKLAADAHAGWARRLTARRRADPGDR